MIAAMREPTEAMRVAGRLAAATVPFGENAKAEAPNTILRAMIDAALKD